MKYVILIIVLASLGNIILGLSADTCFIMLAIGLATTSICLEISKLKDQSTDKKDNGKKE